MNKWLKQQLKEVAKDLLMILLVSFVSFFVFSTLEFSKYICGQKSIFNKKDRYVYDNVHVGTVISKGIEDADAPYNDKYIIRYTITIKVDYEYEGESYTSNKTYVVSEDVYKSYEIGDTFDENNLKIYNDSH